MGTSTAGIAHAAIAAHIMGLPMGYVALRRKDHGRKNQIEGKLEPGQKVVVVEDLISTGGSVHRRGERPARGRRRGAGHRQHLHLRHEEGPGPSGRGQRAETSALPTSTPSPQVAAEEGYIQQEDIARLIAFPG